MSSIAGDCLVAEPTSKSVAERRTTARSALPVAMDASYGFVAAAAVTPRAAFGRQAVCARPAFRGAQLAVRPANTPVAPPMLPAMPEIEAIRHGKKVPKLNKAADQRKALLRALTTELIRHGRIKTTHVRAKAVRKHADHMITLAKDGSLHARRQALGYVYDKQLVHALFDQAPERYGDTNGGYTRVLRTVPRRGDNAAMGIVELV